MLSLRWVIPAVALLLVSACAKKNVGQLGFPTRGSTPATPADVRTTDGSLARKKVAGKEEPATLIAVDRSRCIVPATRYKNTEIGSDEWCDWRTGGRAP